MVIRVDVEAMCEGSRRENRIGWVTEFFFLFQAPSETFCSCYSFSSVEYSRNHIMYKNKNKSGGHEKEAQIACMARGHDPEKYTEQDGTEQRREKNRRSFIHVAIDWIHIFLSLSRVMKI